MVNYVRAAKRGWRRVTAGASSRAPAESASENRQPKAGDRRSLAFVSMSMNETVTVDETRWYRAVVSRDARFDGRFFSAVVTTGIYCRPICPARTPLRKNVRFFACAAAAEEAGFRPCRRCRPESAPGTPSWMGTSATVARALRLIDTGALDHGGVDRFAARLGVGARQLRRLFTQHLGTSPTSMAASRRNHSARLLIDATRLPMTRIAAASGFRSVRQFNGVMRGVFGRTPTALRGVARSRAAAPTQPRTVVTLAFRPPFDWGALLDFLRARAIPGVEAVSDGRYRRTFVYAGARGAARYEVALAHGGRALELEVRGAEPTSLLDIVGRVRRQFDLDADPLAIASSLGATGLLAASVRARPGLRVPGAWDRFEVMVRAIIGQQISVAAATTLCGRLVRQCGTAASVDVDVNVDDGLTHLFPTPRQILNADPTTLGLPRFRAESLRGLAAAIEAEPGLLDPAPSLDHLIALLSALPGVGPWTAHYAAMRAFNEPDGFPSDDLILRRAAGGISGPALERLSQAWRPWRAYAAMHLWTQHSQGERA